MDQEVSRKNIAFMHGKNGSKEVNWDYLLPYRGGAIVHELAGTGCM